MPEVPSHRRSDRKPVGGGAARAASPTESRLVSSPDYIVSEILRGLYSGRYVPGQRLIEADLTRGYKVSRGSIREALKRLAAEGVVSLNLHRGAYIRALSRCEVKEVLAVIEVLTGLAARLAAERIHEEGNAPLMRAALAQLVEAAHNDFFDFVRARNRFYRRLLRVGGNRELSRMLPSMHVHLVRAQFRPYSSSDEDERVEDYVRIVDAVLAGDPEAAEQATRRHVRATSDFIQRLPDDVFAVED
jgi:DNA-binding GntR family transcriptional regulator